MSSRMWATLYLVCHWEKTIIPEYGKYVLYFTTSTSLVITFNFGIWLLLLYDSSAWNCFKPDLNAIFVKLLFQCLLSRDLAQEDIYPIFVEAASKIKSRCLSLRMSNVQGFLDIRKYLHPPTNHLHYWSGICHYHSIKSKPEPQVIHPHHKTTHLWQNCKGNFRSAAWRESYTTIQKRYVQLFYTCVNLLVGKFWQTSLHYLSSENLAAAHYFIIAWEVENENESTDIAPPRNRAIS